MLFMLRMFVFLEFECSWWEWERIKLIINVVEVLSK